MPPRVYLVQPILGLRRSARRVVALLRSDDDNRVNAGEAFENLSARQDREVRTRMDYWINGGTNDRWFHGWPNDPKYKRCFVFKWKEQRQGKRLYGFLCHPKPSSPRLSLCVLGIHATKNERETDISELDRIVGLMYDNSVKIAIKQSFEEGSR